MNFARGGLWRPSRSGQARLRIAAAVGVLAIVAAGCANSGGSSGSSSAAPGVTATGIRIGFLTTLTGPLASGFTTASQGFDARIALQNAQGGVNGRKITVVPADDLGTTAGATSAVKTLVQEKSIFAMGAVSFGFQGPSVQYLREAGVPVTGVPVAGNDWAPPNTNMFAANGSPNPSFPAPKEYGSFFKSIGATNVAAVSDTSAAGSAMAKNVQASSVFAGLKSTYVNTTVPESTEQANWVSIATAMKNQNVDAVFGVFEPAPALQLLQAIKQVGLNLKAFVMAVDPPASVFQNAQVRSLVQGTWTIFPYTPPTDDTPATKSMLSALKTYEHQTTLPDENEDDGWAAASALIQGLQMAGKDPTRAAFMKDLRADKSFNADGLAISPVDMSTSFGTGPTSTGPAPNDCVYYMQYEGAQYKADSQPFCGGQLSS